MTATNMDTATLADAIWPRSDDRRALRWAVLVIAGTALIAICAKIKVPFYPVPMTMQTFAIMLIAVAYGARLAGVTVLLYMAEGAAGLPIFASAPEQGVGLAYMVGPTGGYLAGFVVAAFCVGALTEQLRDRSPLNICAAMLIGVAVIYALGLAWLGYLFGWDKPLLQLGFYPFILGDLVKITLATAVLTVGWKIVRPGKS